MRAWPGAACALTRRCWRARNAVLIPLIKTKPGELSYDVEAVYRLRGEPLPRHRDHTLHDPALVGITVERTVWNLYLPAGFCAGQVGGNMEQVLGKVAVADKLDDALKELRDLSSIASAAENGYVTRNNAVSNFGRLKDDIAKQNGTQADIESPQPGKNELAFNKGKDGRPAGLRAH